MSVTMETLSLLAFVLTDGSLGKVHYYELPERARDAWDDLHGRFVDVTGSTGSLPFAGLATVLRAIGRTSVNFDPPRMDAPPLALITRHPLKADDVADAITIWEQVVLQVPAEKISLSYRSPLAKAISGVSPELRRLSGFIEPEPQPNAPSWVWRAATWEIAQRLAAASSSWTLDGRILRLRADTDGDLIVWDPELLWEVSSQRGPPFRACLRIELAMVNFPGMREPVVVLNPIVSHLTPFPNFAGQTWLAQRAANAPLMKVQLDRGRLEYSSHLALQLFSALRMQRVPLVAKEMDLADMNGPLRSLRPRTTVSHIGGGVGMFFVRELHSFAAAALGLPQLKATRQRHQFSTANLRKTHQGRDAELLDPQQLSEIIKQSGCDRLRILVLYAHEHMRARMQSLLAYHFARPELAQQGIPESQPTALSERVEVIVQHAPEFLKHGPHDQRATLASRLRGLEDAQDVRTVALCETEYDREQWDAMRQAARRGELGAQDPDAVDAKHVVNRLLAERGVAAQFLSASGLNPAQAADDMLDVVPEHPQDDDYDDVVDPLSLASAREIATSAAMAKLAATHRDDHPGHNALADMLRVAGLVHPRLTHALGYGDRGVAAGVSYVGLHVRRQASKGKTAQKLSWSLVALTPRGNHWRVLSYLVQKHPRLEQTGWSDYTAANNAFRANPYPLGHNKDDEVRQAVDAALQQLAPQLDPKLGYVLLISGNHGAKRLWPGLQNQESSAMTERRAKHKAPRFLPGYSNSAARPRAIVRVSNATLSGLPRPVRATVEGNDGTEERVKMTSSSLYRLEGAKDTWILSNIPRQFKAGTAHARLGEKKSRWLATRSEHRKVWYAHTATEIHIVTHDGEPARYAVAAARLCHHAISWDGRTNYPAPIHLAIQMDKNHPDYRRHSDADD